MLECTVGLLRLGYSRSEASLLYRQFRKRKVLHELQGRGRLVMTQAHYQLEGLAFVGKRGQPLLVKNFSTKDDLDLHCLLYTALDYVDMRLGDISKYPEEYLGLVNHVENLNIYAYVTNTMVKILVAIRWTGTEPKELIVKSMLLKMHDEYVALVSNPFYALETYINVSSPFASRIEAIGSSYMSE